MRYGIASFKNNGVGITRFTNAHSISDFAKIYTRSLMREEGFKFNHKGRFKYLEGWMDHYNEMKEGEEEENQITNVNQIVDEVANNITYSNVHLQKLEHNSNTWVPLSNKETSEFNDVIVRMFEESIEAAKTF